MHARLLWMVTPALVILSSCTPVTTGGPQVLIDTTMGKIKVELWPHKAPNTVKNFLQYVDDKYYDGTIFHMVVADSRIEAGGFVTGMVEKPAGRDTIRAENSGASNNRATIAAVAGSDGVGSRFFINTRDNPSLDRTGVVFGHVLEGMAVADEIRRAEVRDKKVKGFDNVPVEQIVIKSIRRLDSK